MDAYKRMYLRNRETAGKAPLVFFLDWPNQEINGYYALPLEQKKDFWRIFAAEAYASGCYYAFHLSNVMPGEPTAEESGVLDFMAEYAGYYRKNSGLYHGNEPSARAVSLSQPRIAYNLMEQAEQGRLVLHLINHDYAAGVMRDRTGITAELPLPEAPSRVYAVSPDRDGERELVSTYAGGSLSIQVGSLAYYEAVVIVGKTPTPTPGPEASAPPQVLELRPTSNPMRQGRMAVAVKLAGDVRSVQVGLYSAANNLAWRGDFTGPFSVGWNRLQWTVSGLGGGAYYLTAGANGGRRGPTTKVYVLPGD